MNTKRKAALVTVILLLGLSGLEMRSADAGGYRFTMMAETDGSQTLSGLAVINEQGMVAFRATHLDAEQLIFTSNASTLRTVAQTSGPFQFMNPPGSINDSGVVAFFATLDTGFPGIFSGDGGPTTTVALGGSGGFNGIAGGFPSINNSGAVAFTAFTPGHVGVFASTAAVTIKIADTSGPLFGISPVPRMNDTGTVAFFASLDAGGQGVFTGAGGPLTTIADTSGVFSSFRSVAISNEGAVAFIAALSAGGFGIFTNTGGVITTLVDTNGPFSDLQSLDINDDGTVAFGAVLTAGGRGVFTGPDSIADLVIGPGEPLFGSTVTDAMFFGGLNNLGQIAFKATLADGREVIVRAERDTATPPGTGVTVEPVDPNSDSTPVTVTFDQVTGSGTTTVTTSGTGTPPPTGLKLGSPPTYYEVSTTATVSGPITVCIHYTGVSFGNEQALKLMHQEDTNGDGVADTWVDRTTSLDTVNDVICATVPSLSLFAIFEPEPYRFSGFFSPTENPPTVNSVRAGAAVPVKFSLGGNRGLDIFKPGYPTSRAVACSTGVVADEIEQTVTAGQSGLQYDPSTDQYTYVWKSSTSWKGTCRQFDLGLNDDSIHVLSFRFPNK